MGHTGNSAVTIMEAEKMKQVKKTGIKYTAFANVAALDKKMASVAKRGASLVNDVQDCAVGILFHAAAHSDYSRANQLVISLPNGLRRNSLVKWFATFGGLVLDKPEKGKTSKGFTGWKGRDYIQSHLEQAKDSLWHEAIKEAPVFRPFDIDEKVRALIAEVVREQKKAEKLSDLEKARNKYRLNEELGKQMMALLLPQFEVVEEEEQPNSIDEALKLAVGQ